MKLEVGMYVRTKKGTFDRLVYKRKSTEANYIWYSFEERGAITNPENYILKASHNIIDLIEERDFVKVRIDGIFSNWFMVDLFEDENENQELGIGCYEDGLLNSISEYRPLNTLEILEVVTKEQFESMSYKVGD